METVNSDTLNTTVEVLERVMPLFVWVVSGCASAIVAMGLYGAWIVKQFIKLQKESNITISNNTNSNVNLANAIESLPDKIELRMRK